jgi:hypothetical protein
MRLEKRLIGALLAGVCLALLSISGCAQDPAGDEDARSLWDSEFLKKRAPSKSQAPARKATGYRRVTPKPATPAAKPTDAKPVVAAAAPMKSEGEMLGLTVWRFRRASSGDSEDSRLLLEEEPNSEKIAWTLERTESEGTFNAGDLVRIGVESPRDGYLYVIDRELYTDGSMSDPYLIYPTLRNRKGDNAVSAGKLIELPGRSAFRLKSTRDDYAGESLTLLVTPKPLEEITIGEKILKLDSDLVERWEKQWSAQIERFELVGGKGKPYSKAEKEAGQDGARILTQDDEMPQTLYRVVAKSGDPLLLKVPLRVKK